MYRLFTAALLILCCLPAVSSAQSFWRGFERPNIGGGILFYDYRENGRFVYDPGSEASYRNTFAHYSFQAGFNLPAVALNEDIAVCLNPALGLSAATKSDFYGSSSNFITIEAPIYATVQIGTDASFKGSKFPLGAALGLGYHYSYVIGTPSDLSEGVGNPSIMAEISIGKRKSWGLIKIRYTQDITSHTIDYSDASIGVEHTLNVRRAGIHLIYVGSY